MFQRVFMATSREEVLRRSCRCRRSSIDSYPTISLVHFHAHSEISTRNDRTLKYLLER